MQLFRFMVGRQTSPKLRDGIKVPRVRRGLVCPHHPDRCSRDKERAEAEAFNRLKAELTRAFAAPEESYRPLTAAEVIARNRG